MNRTATGLAGLSAACLAYGAWLVYVPAGVIVLGLALALAAWLVMDVDEDGPDL